MINECNSKISISETINMICFSYPFTLCKECILDTFKVFVKAQNSLIEPNSIQFFLFQLKTVLNK